MITANRLVLPTFAWIALTAACSAADGSGASTGTHPDGGASQGGGASQDGSGLPDTAGGADGNVSPDTAALECTESTACNDDNPCTDDTCSPSGTCEHVANNAPCDDGNPCTEQDTCVDASCASGSNACPCANDADCSAFEDGNLCNGVLACSSAHECAVVPASIVTCPTELDTACRKSTCEPLTGDCGMVELPDGTPCNDGDSCTSAESCRGGACQGSEACCSDGVDNDGDQHADCDDPDCTPLPACDATCPTLDPVDESPLPVQSAGNAVMSTTVNGHDDDYVFNQAGNRKLGVRKDWGGAIVFFGLASGTPGMNTTNAVDGNDTGREVQIALYDPERWYQGCAWNASCTTTPTSCPETMAFFGWNPVQGGNRCNHGSDFDDARLEEGTSTITTTPLFWNPNWDRADCQESCNNPSTDTRRSDIQLTQKVRFVRADVVELSYEITNLGDLNHKSAAHEFPTLYASFGKNGTPDLFRLIDSTSTELTTGWQTDAHGFRYQNFTSPGGWASLQNQNLDYGVALYYEAGMTSFQAWNKADNPKFNNFRGLFAFPIGPHAQVRARSYLILGSLASVGAQTQWLDDNLPPFGWLDSPVPDAGASGHVSVHGWAMDNKAVSAVQMIIDGGAPTQLSYGAARPDVCAVWPGYPACGNGKVGFEGSFDADTLAANPCGHVIEIKAIDNQGNAKMIARQRFYPGT